ncbi:hypothetical protein KZZ52_11460 [Dactylosporangium sp. AC04546]|uniref:hypothetical protein n=1 Tax=Dactylosporangium sp. AC04546 TaxID=2862460 RepID=UPI001EDEDB68|nr:hypothetical protein [Dactylosporangium sp. AC04546]WVK85966.1 hypothetical protein KZZ52_11460 [Dactylosporangium sp. AC04546]
MGRFLLGAIAIIVGLFVAGAIAIWLFGALFKIAIYVLVGAVVVGGAMYLYGKAKRSLGTTRNQRRIEAAMSTWKQRNR